jgi:hypothetical protein
MRLMLEEEGKAGETPPGFAEFQVQWKARPPPTNEQTINQSNQ